MNSRSDSGDDVIILILALVALVFVVTWAMLFDSEGQEPIPLPTSPPATVTLDE